MSKSIIKPAFSTALGSIKLTQSSPEQDDPVARQIFQWLGRLKLLHQVPFHYLVPDERLLPPETIRFFHLDMNWVNALADGAYSIGRYATGLDTQTLYNQVEGSLQGGLMSGANAATRQVRSGAFKTNAVNDNTAAFEVVTGFLLRSEVVRGWPSMEAVAYEKSNYPDLPNWDGSSLKMLRYEHLSDEVLIGIFEGELYRLDLHEPAEGLHFGFDTDPDSNDALEKSLRDPNTGEKFSPQKTLSTQQLNTGNIFRNGGTASGPNAGGQVLNLYNLSAMMFATLGANTTGYVEPVVSQLKNESPQNVSGLSNDANPLVSSDFALQMVEGVGMVTFYNAAPGDPVACTSNPA
ncbi:MAG: hypothetical protein J0L99_04520 [Chitinophagales bacterium]|nr:hypothetical protein [Chitinophagales bacterium]